MTERAIATPSSGMAQNHDQGISEADVLAAISKQGDFSWNV